MSETPSPVDEELRRQALQEYNVLSADFDEMFDDITLLAADVCDKPISLVTLVGADRQWSRSKVDGNPQRVDINNSICAHTLNQSGVFEVCDTLLDPRFKENSQAIGSSKFRHYAGVPLVTPSGQVIGTLCVIDTKPGELRAQQKSMLKFLARDVVSQLELHKKNAELAKLKELYELIVETNSDLIFAKDSDFRILHANSAFLALYPDAVTDKVIGYTTVEDYKEEEAKVFIQQDRLAFELGKTEVTEKILFPNGESKTLFTTKTRFEDQRGEQFILGVSRDISEQEALIAQLKKSNSDLDEFAYIASHDLKASLNAIKTLVLWIEEDAGEKFDEDSRKHFLMIESRANRMSKLLGDLLIYARIGKDDAAPENINLKAIAADCYLILDLAQNFSLHVDDVELVLPIQALELVLSNLLSNALKHHDKTQGQIRITCVDEGSAYRLTVTDDGPGIAPSLHKKIFAKFQTLKEFHKGLLFI